MIPLNQTRDISIDVLKSIGIIFMLLGHTGFGEKFAMYIAGFHMQLFFIVSGLLMSKSKYNWKTFIVRRIKSLLIPYIFFAVVTIIICVCINIFSENVFFECSLFFKGIVYSNQGIFPITGAIWFLQCLFISSIISFFVIRIHNKSVQVVSVFVLISLSWFLSVKSIILPFSIDSAISASVFICLGYKLKKKWRYCDCLCIKNPTFFKVLLVVLFVSSYLLISLNGVVSPRKCVYNNILLYYVNALLGTYLWYLVSTYVTNNYSNSCFVDSLIHIGKNSIMFLGFNQLVIKGVLLFLPHFMLSNPLLKIVRQMLLFFFSLLLLKVISQVVIKSRLRFIFQK